MLYNYLFIESFIDCPTSSQTCENDKTGYAAINGLFSSVDTNQDGYITAEESRVFFEQKLDQGKKL